MIRLVVNVDDISVVILVYDQVQIQRGDYEAGPFTTVSGLGPVTLLPGVTSYTATDSTGISSNWYRSRYYSTSTGNYSSWTDPVLGDSDDLFYNPLFPKEINLSTAQQLVVDRIRRLVGDPLEIQREYGEQAAGSIHFDNKTYELPDKGWPASVHMANAPYNTSLNPTINGYRYLRFDDDISTTTISGGVEYGVDIWYYTFRWSDREILAAYDNTPPPTPLTTVNCTSEVYMLACAYDLLSSETWEDLNEDGAMIKDEGSVYDPSPGLRHREEMLKRLKKRLDDAIKSVQLLGVTGVLID